MNDIYCNNCGKPGHNYSICKIPITSIGIVVFRKNNDNNYEYLMIRRKDTLGYIDFMRGKYSIYNKPYIMNMLKQMTDEEKECLKTEDFDTLWHKIWGSTNISSQYKSEENISREKFNTLTVGILVKDDLYNLKMLVEESYQYDKWTEAEWGFPKGRRNYQEKDYECALREFSEETGYPKTYLKNVYNIIPFEEIFTGSNYKSYKHKYYLMNMSLKDSLENVKFENTEVSKMEWKTFENCIKSIRYYNVEKQQVITNIHNALTQYTLVKIQV
jgi:8-oxo-dGTP pyrophosphatase MutT (NUDIX family)